MIGSGYFSRPDEDWPEWMLHNLWVPQIRKATDADIRIIAVGGSGHDGIPGLIDIVANLMHVHNLLGKAEPKVDNALCGWSATLVTLAMLAYMDRKDLIFVEADALCFGPWVEQLYADCEGKQMVFGRSRTMPCAQSLILIKHAFIPTFVANYIDDADERKLEHLPEKRFMGLMRRFPEQIGQFSFGCDRERPLPIGDPVFYAQKFTRQELLTLRSSGLIDFTGQLPNAHEVFSSTK